MNLELIADYHCTCGEGPLWHPLEQKLYWLDIENPRMFRYDPKTGAHEQFFGGETVGGFTVQAVSSITFGGADYTDAYITTAGGDHKDTDGEHAGALYRIRGLAQGLPEFTSQVLI